MNPHIIRKLLQTLFNYSVIVVFSVIIVHCSRQEEEYRSSTRSFDFYYNIDVSDIPSGAKNAYAWVPFPMESLYQRINGFTVVGDYPYTIVEDEEFGNRFFRFDLSNTVENGTIISRISITFKVERDAYNVLNSGAPKNTGIRPSIDRYLARNDLVPIDGIIAEEAMNVVDLSTDNLTQSRQLYDHVVNTVVYDKSGEGWGRGDAIFACNVRTGNCTDFHSLFIGEARSLNIPARFTIGFPLPENLTESEIPGYHCWAEFWNDEYGWVPIDASEAFKFPEKREIFFGGLDANRIQFTIGRDLTVPGVKSGTLNYSVYPYVEVDGQHYDKVSSSFAFKDVAGHN